MNRVLKHLFVFALAAALAACGSSAPKRPIATPSGPVNLDQEGLVIMSAFAIEDGTYDMVKFYLQREDSPQNEYYLFSDKNTDNEFVLRMKPGRYKFIIFTDELLVQPREPLAVTPFDPQKGIPLTPIEVTAGSVTHVGRILISGIDGGTVASRAPGVSYQIIDRTDAAKASLQKRYPDLVPKLETKLIEVLP